MSGEEADLVDRARARVGTTVGGKYRLDRILGLGGMAAVYAATHRNGHRVALKILNPDLSARGDMRARFRREGQAANTVNHPGVVVVTDDDVAEDGSAFLVMELLSGEVVEKIWERHGFRLPVDFVLALGRELCAVLAAAHRVGIVHRDLKPENLFVTTEGKLKVLDFGLASLRDLVRPKETYTGMIFGTPAFMPPEQARGKTSQIDARTDLWAVGATMFTLLSGRMVHEGETAQDFVLLSATEPARSLKEVLPDAHPELVSVVNRALTFDKDLRWQSAADMGEGIRKTSRMLLGDAEVPLVLLGEASDPDLEHATQVGHIFEPVSDTLDDKTKIGLPPELDSSAPPTEPKGKAVAAPMASETPTKERPRAIEEDNEPEPQTLVRDSEEEPPTQIRRAPPMSEERTEPRLPRVNRMPPQPITQPALTAVRPALDTAARLPPGVQSKFEATMQIGPPTPQRVRTPQSVRQNIAVAATTPPARPTMRTIITRPKPRRTPLLPLIGAGLLLLATPVVYFAVRRAPPRPVATATPEPPSAVAPPPSVVILSSPTLPVASSAVPALSAPPPASQHPVAHPIPSTPEAETEPTVPPNPYCKQPFVLDDAGIKHWKLGCF